MVMPHAQPDQTQQQAAQPRDEELVGPPGSGDEGPATTHAPVSPPTGSNVPTETTVESTPMQMRRPSSTGASSLGTGATTMMEASPTAAQSRLFWQSQDSEVDARAKKARIQGVLMGMAATWPDETDRDHEKLM